MTKPFENGCITPHGKAAIVADLLARTSVFREPVSFSLLHHHVMQQFGVPEEQIGGSIVDATFLLARAGLLHLAPQADTIGQGTTVQASSGLVSYMWGQDPIDLTA